MSDLPPLTPEEEFEALAGEQALGLLDGEDLAQAQALMREDPSFAAAVRDWEERLAVLAEELTPVMAPARAKVMIDRTLGHTRPAQLHKPGGAASSLMRWLMGAVAAAAVVLAVMYLPPMLTQNTTPVAEYYASEMVANDRNLKVIAELDTDDGMMEVIVEQGTMPETGDYELWWIDGEGATPVSLGVVPRSGSGKMPVPAGLVPHDQTVLALTEEPLGGSATGLPTGPVIASGALTIL